MIKRIFNKIDSIYRHRYLAKYENGAYKFLLHKIHKSTDIDFIEAIWQLDYFREIVQPQPLELKELKKVLVLAPHQDDEAIGCGGTLQKLVENKCDLTIGFLTDGAESSNPIESITTRRLEAENVCNALNADLRELNISNISMEVKENHVHTLTNWLNEDWDTIFTVWPIDQPPKHRVCAYLLGKALELSRYSGSINLYAVHTDLLPNVYVDISTSIEEKQKLLSLYPSQMNAQKYNHLSKGLDAWRSRFLPVSGEARYIETFMQIPAIAYKDFMEVYKRVNSHNLMKGNEVCEESFKKLKQ